MPDHLQLGDVMIGIDLRDAYFSSPAARSSVSPVFSGINRFTSLTVYRLACAVVPEARVFTKTSSAPCGEDGTFARPTPGYLPRRRFYHGTDNVRPVSPCCYHSSSADWSWVRHQLDAVVSDSHQADTIPGYSGQLRHHGVLIARLESIHASTTMCASAGCSHRMSSGYCVNCGHDGVHHGCRGSCIT